MKACKIVPVLFSIVLSCGMYGQQTTVKADQKPATNQTNATQVAKPVFSKSAIKNATETVEEMNKELNLNNDDKQKLIDIIAEKNQANINAMNLSAEEKSELGKANFNKYLEAINKTFGSELAAKVQQSYLNYKNNQKK